MALNLRRLWRALKGSDIDRDRWVEAEAKETRAELNRMGIFAIVTAADIKNESRWGAQAKREQLDIAWEAQAKREALDIARQRQRDKGEGRDQ